MVIRKVMKEICSYVFAKESTSIILNVDKIKPWLEISNLCQWVQKSDKFCWLNKIKQCYISSHDVSNLW